MLIIIIIINFAIKHKFHHPHYWLCYFKCLYFTGLYLYLANKLHRHLEELYFLKKDWKL